MNPGSQFSRERRSHVFHTPDSTAERYRCLRRILIQKDVHPSLRCRDHTDAGISTARCEVRQTILMNPGIYLATVRTGYSATQYDGYTDPAGDRNTR
jgi:hypothetical protein